MLRTNNMIRLVNRKIKKRMIHENKGEGGKPRGEEEKNTCETIPLQSCSLKYYDTLTRTHSPRKRWEEE